MLIAIYLLPDFISSLLVNNNSNHLFLLPPIIFHKYIISQTNRFVHRVLLHFKAMMFIFSAHIFCMIFHNSYG
nr:MAG TPA: hypothetical protein [Caudoviricetes sp.]